MSAQKTRDHKLPRKFGGANVADNIVRCCQMCNVIKGSRPYELFVVFFWQFLVEHGAEYRAADPDHGTSIRAMSRKFNVWLYGLQHAQEAQGVSSIGIAHATSRESANHPRLARLYARASEVPQAVDQLQET